MLLINLLNRAGFMAAKPPQTVPEPSAATSGTQPVSAAINPRHTPPNKEIPMHSLFARSPLASTGSLSVAETDRLMAIYRRPDVQRAAGELFAVRDHVAGIAAFHGIISEAVDVAHPAGVEVVEVLRSLIDQAKQELEAVVADRRAHDAAIKVRREVLMPLEVAVGHASASASVGRAMLQSHIDAALGSGKHGVSASAGASRYAALQAAGLSEAQIAGLGVTTPEVDVQKLQGQVADVDRVLAKLKAFSADTTNGVEQLVGLPGFDALIAARRAAEQESA